MGAFTSYAIYSSIFLLMGYLIYKWLMAGEKQPALNRATLIFIYLISLLAFPVVELIGYLATSTTTSASSTEIEIGSLEIVKTETTKQSIIWATVVVYTYIAGVAITAMWSIISFFRIKLLLTSGRTVEYNNDVNLILLPSGKTTPFSWMNYIVMTEEDYNHGGDIIIAHEMAHIRQGHCFDLILAQLVCVVQWFNPAAWLMREELKAVHEFQADNIVLNSGIEARQYQMLLIKKAVGTRFQSLANSLNQSNLKKRITMMYFQKSSAGRKMRVLALVPAIGLALAVCKIPAVASTISVTSEVNLSTASESEIPANKVSENSVNSQTESTAKAANVPEQLPQYPGGEMAMQQFLMNNLKYPATAEASGEQGRVVVKFVVEADGSIGDTEVQQSVSPSLDAEAVRVTKSMPRWIPGKSNGKAVACTYSLPISFKLPPKKKK